jgi:formylglycine-generating enzyme required for sulfatase activity
MSGNVWEWNDSDGKAGAFPAQPARQIRGGNFNATVAGWMSSNYSVNYAPAFISESIGFRIAAVPEPATWVMALAGLACGAWQAVRRRRRPR